LYNFSFDADKGPAFFNATLGFFKTGSPVLVNVLAPNGEGPTPTPPPTPNLNTYRYTHIHPECDAAAATASWAKRDSSYVSAAAAWVGKIFRPAAVG
jgi:hypothetical protein